MLKQTEATFQQTVIDLAHYQGWTVAHFRPARTEQGWRTPVSADGKGFPDLLMIRNDMLIAAELKQGKGKLSPEQMMWLEKFSNVQQVQSHLWYPSDWQEIAKAIEANKGE